MKCAWEAYLNLLPIWMRREVDVQGKDSLQELRLRLNNPPELVTRKGSVWLNRNATKDDLGFCINAASAYSPWAAKTVAQGYITAAGGHRIGLCGRMSRAGETTATITMPTSLCLRVARDFEGIGTQAAQVNTSILIIGRPGSGKTTLLRDIIRTKSEKGPGSVAVVDERGEIFPAIQDQMCFMTGKRTDVLTGCSKQQGIESVLRTMNPEIIAVDEITAQEDCQALIHAGWCGVKLLATAHAGNKMDLLSRSVYKPLIESNLFETLLILQPDKTWKLERTPI